MKKIIFSILICFSFTLCANAQILRAEDVENYAKEKYGKNWIDAALNLASSLELDKNYSLTYVEVIEAPNKSRELLYILLNYWFTASFNDANSVIKLNDKELGTIIASGFIEGVALHTGGANSYKVNLRPVIKCDIKDNKIRITYTVPYYSVVKAGGGGIMGAIGGIIPIIFDEKWTLDKCYPFDLKDRHKNTSSKAFVMAHAYSNVIIDKIEEVVKNGLIGNEDEDW